MISSEETKEVLIQTFDIAMSAYRTKESALVKVRDAEEALNQAQYELACAESETDEAFQKLDALNRKFRGETP